MADTQELSPTEQAFAQQAAKTAITKWKAEAKEMLAERNNFLYLAGEDLGGMLLGGGLDLASRALCIRFVKRKTDEAGNYTESEEDQHRRWEHWTGGLSAVVGGASWVGAIVMSQGEMTIHPLKQTWRTASAAQLLLGVNRLVSPLLKLPA